MEENAVEDVGEAVRIEHVLRHSENKCIFTPSWHLCTYVTKLISDNHTSSRFLVLNLVEIGTISMRAP